MSLPIPVSRTEIGSSSASPSDRASTASSGRASPVRIGTSTAAAARPVSSRPRTSRVLDRSWSSGTQRSSVRTTCTRAQSMSAADSTSKTGPGVVPPGTANEA